MADKPFLLKPKEAATRLRISERTLWGMKRRGEIPCVQLGRNLLYDPADIQALIERRKTVDVMATAL